MIHSLGDGHSKKAVKDANRLAFGVTLFRQIIVNPAVSAPINVQHSRKVQECARLTPMRIRRRKGR